MGRRALDLLSPASPPRAWLPLVLGAMMLASAPAAVHAQERARIDLDGAWQFQTDPQQRGERERWAAASATPLARTIQVPGAWQAQGVGELAGILRHHYAGDAWYRRTVAVPAAWKGKRVRLTIGGAHRATTLFVNGTAVGPAHEGFSAPFAFDLSDVIRPGRENTIALRVSNPGVTDLESPDKQAGAQATGMLNYIANWGGFYSHVALEATDRDAWIEQILIVPDAANKRARVEVRIGGANLALAREATLRATVVDASGAALAGAEGQARIQAAARAAGAASAAGAVATAAPAAAGKTTTDVVKATDVVKTTAVVTATAVGMTATIGKTVDAVGASGGGLLTAVIDLPMNGAQLWTPDDPRLYTVRLALADRGGRVRDRAEERFGLRTIATAGTRLLLNGQPLYLRGYGDDNIEVLSGLPPGSKVIYRERLARAKAFGFNAVRFHSMTPDRDYFEAADEVGMLVMAELPIAYTQYLLPHQALLRGELARTLIAHRNHPSLLSFAFGNEFTLGWLKTDAEKQAFQQAVAEFYALAKSLDPTRPILSNDGRRMEPTDMLSLPDGHADGVPTLRHEFGEYYCSLPDPALIPQFTGVVAPTWLEAKRAWVQQQGLAADYPTYVRHSQRLQQLGRTFQIERARLDPRVTGYHYWLIVDFPGGTGEGDSWEEGWFDYFWQPKGVTPEEGRRINSAVLPLIDAGVDQRTFWSDAGRRVQVTVSNYGDAPLADAVADWRWVSGTDVLASGTARVSVAQGEVRPVFTATLPNGPADRAAAVDLEVTIAAARGPVVNRWRFWSIPASGRTGIASAAGLAAAGDVRVDGRAASDGLMIASRLDADVRAALEAGRTVLLLAAPDAPAKGGGAGASADAAPKRPRPLTFFPGAGAALGTIVRPHPALEGFPHEGFADLQFYNLVQGAGALTLDAAPRGQAPIIDAVRTAAGWLSKEKALTHSAFLVEAQVGRGRLLATTLNVRAQLDDAHPEVVWLFERLVRYARSGQFAPRETLTWAQLEAMVAGPAAPAAEADQANQANQADQVDQIDQVDQVGDRVDQVDEANRANQVNEAERMNQARQAAPMRREQASAAHGRVHGQVAR